MRRVNIQAAFLGEGGESDTGDEEGLALSVRGGEIVAHRGSFDNLDLMTQLARVPGRSRNHVLIV